MKKLNEGIVTYLYCSHYYVLLFIYEKIFKMGLHELTKKKLNYNLKSY